MTGSEQWPRNQELNVIRRACLVASSGTRALFFSFIIVWHIALECTISQACKVAISLDKGEFYFLSFSRGDPMLLWVMWENVFLLFPNFAHLMHWFSNQKRSMFIPDSKSKAVTDFLGHLNKFGGGNCQEFNRSADPHRQSMWSFSVWALTLSGHKGTGKHTLLSLYQQLLPGYY